MKLRFILRPSLAIVFGFMGSLIAQNVTPMSIFAIFGDYFLIIASVAFGILGFILPEVAELAGRAGIAALARQIASHLPDPAAAISVPRFAFRRRKSKKMGKYLNPMILDTSAIIDGRLLDIAKTGFIFGTFMVIPSVIFELHQLADSSDELKRSRGRRGLDILAALQKTKQIHVVVLASEPTGNGVDEKLIKVAKSIKGKVVTVDFNLNKVAQVQKIAVLNLNELANASRTAVIAHQILKIQVRDMGRGKYQGVGYLADGTMVVVENGANLIGKNVEVEVLRVLQTAAGKMIFAKPVTGS